MELNKINKNCTGIWFFGLSGSGKTISSSFIKKNILKDALVIDGDDVRKFISSDLGYEIKDRKIQVSRILGICKLCIKSNIFPICSTVYMHKNLIYDLKKLRIKVIEIKRNVEDLSGLPIYKDPKNVLGIDLQYENKMDVNFIKNESKNQLFKDLTNIFNI
jgi:adenylylsulfate kinase-like enzyme